MMSCHVAVAGLCGQQGAAILSFWGEESGWRFLMENQNIPNVQQPLISSKGSSRTLLLNPGVGSDVFGQKFFLDLGPHWEVGGRGSGCALLIPCGAGSMGMGLPVSFASGVQKSVRRCLWVQIPTC